MLSTQDPGGEKCRFRRRATILPLIDVIIVMLDWGRYILFGDRTGILVGSIGGIVLSSVVLYVSTGTKLTNCMPVLDLDIESAQ